MGRHPTEYYGLEPDDPVKQEIIAHHCLSYKMLGPRIKKFLTNDSKHKLRAFSNAYSFNKQDDGYTMFSVIVKMVLPDTHAECSYIKSNLETMNMSQFKHDTPIANLQISE